jgi:type II secretory pathway pseudopilin PulG
MMRRRQELHGCSAQGRRGFTLIELLVALTGGLFVSLAVFALARDASRFYQREGRLANATMAAVSGFERLRADIARAGFLATPNVKDDPLVCTRPDEKDPPLLRELASVRIAKGGSPASDSITANALQGFFADALWLAGSYSSADEFPIRTVNEAGGAGYVVTLQIDSGAMARLGWGTAGATRGQLLASVFAPGRGLRIRDKQGDQHYGIIQSTQVTGEGLPQITLGPLPALVFRQGQTRLCGFQGNETGATAAVINFIKYDLRQLNNAALYPAYAKLFEKSSNAAIQSYEANRTELVRRELDARVADDDTELAIGGVNQVELVTEYAVGFQMDVTAITANPDLSNPSVAFVGRDDGTFASFTGLPSAAATPQRIRALRVRLAVRSREPDRDANTVAGGFRIGLNTGGGSSGPFARVRTLQADVMLNNNSNATW